MFSEPLSAFVPDQSPEAEQLVAFVLDQLSVTDCPMIIDDGEADMETVGLGRGEVPPPPPPPQFVRKLLARITVIKNSFAFISFPPSEDCKINLTSYMPTTFSGQSQPRRQIARNGLLPNHKTQIPPFAAVFWSKRNYNYCSMMPGVKTVTVAVRVVESPELLEQESVYVVVVAGETVTLPPEGFTAPTP
jgi:hypothetical protein